MCFLVRWHMDFLSVGSVSRASAGRSMWRLARLLGLLRLTRVGSVFVSLTCGPWMSAYSFDFLGVAPDSVASVPHLPPPPPHFHSDSSASSRRLQATRRSPWVADRRAFPPTLPVTQSQIYHVFLVVLSFPVGGDLAVLLFPIGGDLTVLSFPDGGD